MASIRKRGHRYQLHYVRGGKAFHPSFATLEEAEAAMTALPPPGAGGVTPKPKVKKPAKEGPRRKAVGAVNGNGELKTGNVGNSGGGTIANEVRELCRTLIKDRNLTERLADIADGTTDAPVKEQRLAIETLHKWGYSELNRVEHSGPDGGAIPVEIQHAKQALADKFAQMTRNGGE